LALKESDIRRELEVKAKMEKQKKGEKVFRTKSGNR